MNHGIFTIKIGNNDALYDIVNNPLNGSYFEFILNRKNISITNHTLFNASKIQIICPYEVAPSGHIINQKFWLVIAHEVNTSRLILLFASENKEEAIEVFDEITDDILLTGHHVTP